jgi:hypothetical protein
VVRAGTSHFLAEHLNDAGWFQYGSYGVFDQRAKDILDQKEPIFFISAPSRTDLIQYPPGFPLFIAAIYSVGGDHSAYGVLRVQWLLDALIAPMLILAIGVTAFGWRPGLVAGFFAALSPMLAFCGVTPTSDAATSWLVLAAIWVSLAAVKKPQVMLMLAAGLLLGIGCWMRVNPLFLVFGWAVVVAIFVVAPLKKRLGLALALIFGTMLFVAPIALRNIIVFRQVVLTGLNVGSNLWEGLGETEFGRSQGFQFGDGLMVESERAEYGYPADLAMTPVWPDGIARDRERARKSLVVIADHPVWYAGVMAERMYWMLKIWGDSGPYTGTAGINCTASKCLPAAWRNPPMSAAVTVLGGIQSVYRYLAMLLAAAGIVFAFRKNRVAAVLLLATVIYYLVPGTFAHTELRYVLPMHGVLIVFSGLGFSMLLSYFGGKGPTTTGEAVI